jgi:hypothetical protein
MGYILHAWAHCRPESLSAPSGLNGCFLERSPTPGLTVLGAELPPWVIIHEFRSKCRLISRQVFSGAELRCKGRALHW